MYINRGRYGRGNIVRGPVRGRLWGNRTQSRLKPDDIDSFVL